jgi:hypothetical protein
MSEDGKGRVKMTFEVEMNKEFMDAMKECIANMPKMGWKMPKHGEE